MRGINKQDEIEGIHVLIEGLRLMNTGIEKIRASGNEEAADLLSQYMGSIISPEELESIIEEMNMIQ